MKLLCLILVLYLMTKETLETYLSLEVMGPDGNKGGALAYIRPAVLALTEKGL